jgi:hypothetical protein
MGDIFYQPGGRNYMCRDKRKPAVMRKQNAAELNAARRALIHNQHIAVDKESHMSTIIAGRFQQQSEIDAAVEELQRAGFSLEKISSFYVNPPGQHDAYPIGGDVEKSPGAEETDKGATKGVITGAAAGLAAVPVVGPVGPLVGAYIGSLVGSLSELKDPATEGKSGEAEETPPEHRAGLRVAVAADDAAPLAIEVLWSLDAYDIERAEGTIENGDWVDFNPVAPPNLIKLSPERRA